MSLPLRVRMQHGLGWGQGRTRGLEMAIPLRTALNKRLSLTLEDARPHIKATAITANTSNSVH